MEPEPHKAPIRFYEIDLLRFLAALSVVFYHYTFQGVSSHHLNPLRFLAVEPVTKYGYLGVELFYIISGYVVMLSAMGKTIRQFFLSRVTRLYPAYWVACTLTFLVKRLWGPSLVGDLQMPQELHATAGQYAYNMTMLQSFFGVTDIDGPYWSLGIEITFYFLVSLLIGYQLLKHIDWFLIGWLLLAALPHATIPNTAFAYLFFPAYAPYFVGGVLFYLLQQPQGRTRLRYSLLLASYILGVANALQNARVLSEAYQQVFTPAVVAGIITSFFIIFFLVAFRKIDLSRFTWLAWLGAITYPLYLIHSDIAFIAFHHLGNAVNKYVLLAGALVIMLLAAYLIHVLVEKRFSKPLGRQVTKLLAQAELLASNK